MCCGYDSSAFRASKVGVSEPELLKQATDGGEFGLDILLGGFEPHNRRVHFIDPTFRSVLKSTVR
jgi:hypothetical protein